MIDVLRPRLSPEARFQLRDDGTAGVWDPRTGHALEVAADEALLLELIDGQRSLSEIAEQHARHRGYVPFTALRDLLRALARHGLLANSEAELQAAGFTAQRKLLERAADVLLFNAPLPGATWIALVVSVAVAAMGLLGLGQAPVEVTGWDTLWALAGICLALSARGFFRAAAVGLAGVAPARLRFSLSFGLPHFEPDGHGVVLLNRVPRAAAHLAALVGTALAASMLSFRPGLCVGALAVLLVDTIPFEPTSLGHVLGAAFGTNDLRDHARAYLQKRILTRVASSHFFPGEGALITTLLLSLGWFAALIQLLFKKWGVVAVLSMVSAALGASGLEKLLALLGAAVLAICMPASVLGLAVALGRALLSLRPAGENHRGERTGSQLQSADLAAIPIFANLDAPHLAEVAKAVQEVRFPAGARIVSQGEPGDRFFALRSGEVAVLHELPSGLTHEVARLGAGDCFGETALLDRVPRTASVVAATDTTLAVLTSQDFERVRQTLGDVDVTRLLRAAAALHKSAFFGKLPSDRLSALALRLEPRSIDAGTVVVRAGEPGREFYLVGAGTFEVLDAQGKTVGELRPGDHFGEVALLRDVPRTATVRATQNALVLALPKEVFVRAMAVDLTLSSRIEELAAVRSEVAR